MAPVAVRARFCVSDKFSAGREKSLMPASTSAHYFYDSSSIFDSVMSRKVDFPRNVNELRRHIPS